MHYISKHPELVRGKFVLDFAAGSGIAGLAALRAGAARVEAADIDPLAAAAMALNAAANGLSLDVICGDITGEPCRWDVILCGDICYEAPMTRHILPWLRACAANIPVLIAEPQRRYAPREGVEILEEITVPASLELEDSVTRRVLMLQLRANEHLPSGLER